MLFTYKTLDSEEKRVLEAIKEMRYRLRHNIDNSPRRWRGLLARMTRARALRASNSIEGINVSAEDAIAVVDGEDPVDADRDTWNAVRGYHRAMNFILQRCQHKDFRFSRDVLLTLHYMICESDLNADPGNFRTGWVGVRNTQSGDLVYEGVDVEKIIPLVDEVIHYLSHEEVEAIEVKAAMAHLNLTLIHPFKDGNGRAARCLQTAVLANEGIVAPTFSSIEEYIGFHQQEYYDVLEEVAGGKWQPERDSKPWIRFCLTGHFHQARTLLRRIGEIERCYEEYAKLVRAAGLNERTALALIEATFKPRRVRNVSYRISADISSNLASRDLKFLVDKGLLAAEGERKGRYYVATPKVMEIRERLKIPRAHKDPFEDPKIVSSQDSLFEEGA